MSSGKQSPDHKKRETTSLQDRSSISPQLNKLDEDLIMTNMSKQKKNDFYDKLFGKKKKNKRIRTSHSNDQMRKNSKILMKNVKNKFPEMSETVKFCLSEIRYKIQESQE